VLADLGIVEEIQRFARPLEVELAALFSFLMNPDLDTTNWHAEQALRPAVVTPENVRRGKPIRARYRHAARDGYTDCASTRLDSSGLLNTPLRAPAPIVSPHFYPISASFN
jgi:hypothetical protein